MSNAMSFPAVMACHREKHWYEDTDVPKSAEAVYKRMRQQWLKLKARSDEVSHAGERLLCLASSSGGSCCLLDQTA